MESMAITQRRITMTKTIIIVVLASMLAACGPTIYVKPGGSPASFNRDHAKCRYEAMRATGMNSVFSDPLIAGIERNSMTRACLEAEGWVVQQ